MATPSSFPENEDVSQQTESTPSSTPSQQQQRPVNVVRTTVVRRIPSSPGSQTSSLGNTSSTSYQNIALAISRQQDLLNDANKKSVATEAVSSTTATVPPPNPVSLSPLQEEDERGGEFKSPATIEADVTPVSLSTTKPTTTAQRQVSQRSTNTEQQQQEDNTDLVIVVKLFKVWMVLVCIIVTVLIISAILVLLSVLGALDDSSNDSLDAARGTVDFTASPITTSPALPTPSPTTASPTQSPTMWSTLPPILNPQQVAKLLASDGASDDNFGRTVAIYGDTIVVGAPLDDDSGSGSGSAYVFVRTEGTNTWIQQAKLTAVDALPDDRFGRSVAIYQDTIVVGASWLGDQLGGERVFVFERFGSVWNLQKILVASQPGENDYFGYNLAIQGDTIVVGAYGAQRAYVFVGGGTSWTQQAILTSSDGQAGDSFGNAVSVDGDTIVVGALDDDSRSGSAYVFDRVDSVWSEQAKLTASDATSDDIFGRYVAVSGDTIVVGAQWNDDFGASTGSAYVFERVGSTWSEQTKLLASDAAGDAWFGFCVAIRGNTIVIGAVNDDTAGTGNDGGAVYIYVRQGTDWVEEAKLTASDVDVNDDFGYSVGISGGTIVVGSRYADSGTASDVGAVYVFE